MKPKLNFYLCNQTGEPHRLAYLQWGNPNRSRTLICVHGLARNNHDFDALAARLALDYHVICPDVAGRGASDWLSRPADYSYPTYITDFLEFLYSQELCPIHLSGIFSFEPHHCQVNWLGTSMGGLIGMSIAAMPNSPIKRLILNDVGAFIPHAALLRIANYLSHLPSQFADFATAERHLRQTYRNFGQLTDAQWQYLTYHSIRPKFPEGFQLHYDPQISHVFNQATEDVELWHIWEKIHCPVLILRGENSDVLTEATLAEMCRIHPNTQVVTFPNVGHAPALLDEAQQQVIENWLKVQDDKS